MSASKDKKLRQEQKAAGCVDKRTQAEAKAAAERRKSNIKYTIVGIIVVLVLALVFVLNSAWLSRTLTAVTIDGEDYSVAELNYYYSASYMNFYNTYYDYVSYGLFFDPSESLADQDYSEDMTWRDYFLETAVHTMAEVKALNEAAEADGFVLSEEYETQYAETVENFKTQWEAYGYSSLEQYINMCYGKGVTMEMLETELYRNFVASAYSEQTYNNFEYSAQELNSYYSENADSLDRVTYTYVSSSDDSLDIDAIVAAVNGTDEDSFADYMAANYEDSDPITLTYDGASLSTLYSEWLLDSARQPGDAAAFTSEGGTSYAVMFIARDNNDYATVSFRHVLINAEDTDEDGTFSAEEIAAAEAEAQAIYDEWLAAGDTSAESFAELANTYSDDSGSNTTGGLYEDVYRNAMVEPVNDWIFADGRQEGDTGLVSYEGSNYTGTHILYFAGEADTTYAQELADNALRSEDYNTWMEGLTENAVTSTKNTALAAKHI